MSKGRWVLFRSRQGSFVIPHAKLENPRVKLLFKNKDIKLMATIPSFAGKPKKPRSMVKPIRIGHIIKPSKLPVSRPNKPARTPIYRFKRRRRVNRFRLSGIEMKNLRALPGKMGISSFDTEAYIDKTLTYRENRTQIERKLKNIAKIDQREHALGPEQFSADLESHIENLKWKAEAGDIHAARELRMWKKERSRIRVM